MSDEYKESINTFIREMKYKKESSIKMRDKAKIKLPYFVHRPEDIIRWLQNPIRNEEQLRMLSNYLYSTNALYKWTINTVGLMGKYNWKLTQNALGTKKSVKKRKDEYYQAITYVDKLNLPYEMIKVFLTVLKEDWFYGYEIETDDTYFILPLPPQFCRASSINLDGTYNIAFNFAYFDDKPDLLYTYPVEFRKKYNEYKKNAWIWTELDSNSTFCVKFNDEFEYMMPYYAVLFEELANLALYKELKKDKAENDNILLLHQKIPLDEADYNKFALSMELANIYHNMAENGTPDRVGVLTSPMDITSVKTESSKSEKDYVKDATRDVFTASGLPQHLTNADSATSAGLSKAIMVNEQLVFRFYRQIERVINRKLRNKFPSQKLKFSLLNTTTFNQSEVVDMMLKLAQNGLPNKIDVIAATGKTPYEFFNDLELEEGVFDLTELLKPLKTSYTQSGDDSDSGAPEKTDNELTDAGQISRDANSVTD